jgi:pimeloyl-ACP methyl ester carboxylesterase
MTTQTLTTAPPSSWSSFFFNLIYKSATVSAGLVAVLVGLLYYKQESLLYFPEIGGVPRRSSSNPRSYRSPSEYNMPYETHMITCEDGVRIHSWLLLQPDNNNKVAPTIIFFHGNAGNIGLRLPNAYKMFTALRANILLVEYRGYGDSDDNVKPTERGLKLDSQAALRFLLEKQQDKIHPDKIFVFGRSLGGSVAFHMASYAQSNGLKLAGVIVENTFLSISKMVDKVLPLVAPLKSLVLTIGWDSERIAPTITAPILYLAGDKDELVPHSHMLKLHELSKKSSSYAKMHIIRGGTHNDSWIAGGKDYFISMRSFISQVILNEGESSEMGSNNSLAADDGNTSSSGHVASDGGVEVTMGTGQDDIKIENAIPLMPQGIVSMAKEAAKDAANKQFVAASDANKKKEI